MREVEVQASETGVESDTPPTNSKQSDTNTEGDTRSTNLLLSGTSWAGQSPIYHLERQVDYLLRPRVRKAIEAISESSFHFSPCYYPDGSPVRVSGAINKEKEEALLQVVRSLLRQTDTCNVILTRYLKVENV
ncbi:hypothetical protein CEN48_08015 [Fischerella thermalis CCMEE 5282]|uniref:hypothetical protein n=1 Tax=Fischerella thermalis TaxID=372787 RepID=UPI000C801987|nr:hypothetical protein [Fischerella thermalis]PMB15062.1 hypothetical protein CEN48_08015 [Fischerella thermalis CCMEE 5282]